MADILGQRFGLVFGWSADQVIILVKNSRLWREFVQDQGRLNVRRRDCVQFLAVNECELKHIVRG